MNPISPVWAVAMTSACSWKKCSANFAWVTSTWIAATRPKCRTRKQACLAPTTRSKTADYKFAKIYRGEGWNPELRAPLLQPGASVKEGEYLLAVNGKEVRAEDNVYSYFEATAGKQTRIKVGPNADGKDSRNVTVVPVPDERLLRGLAWVEDNRKKVEKLSGGRVAYVYVPDTSAEGFARFNRYFFAQTDKEGAVIDERFNGGGQLADHIVDYLRQPLRNYLTGRDGEGEAMPFPGGAIHGPKVMLINERAGSGGDYLPYTFRQAGLGPLVGKRHLGRARRHRRVPRTHRRRLGYRTPHGHLLPERPVGCRKSGRSGRR